MLYTEEQSLHCFKITQAKQEEEEAKQLAVELGINDEETELKAMIMKRQENRHKEMDSFFDHLASKYGAPSKKMKSSDNKKRKSKIKK